MRTPELEPAQGLPETLVERLRSFVEPVDPECPTQWRGASEGDIFEYVRLCELRAGKKLPVAYLTYLRGLGAADGALFGELKLITDLKRLIGFYNHRSDLEPFSSDFPVCGMYQFSDQISLDMRGAGEPTVVETSDGGYDGELSKSWEALVMQASMLRVEARRLPLMRWFSRSSAALQKIFGPEQAPQTMQASILEFAERHGMQQSWVSDARHHIFVGETCSLYTEVDYTGGTFHRVFSAEQSFLDAVQSQLEPRLGAGKSGRFVLQNGKVTSVKP